MDRRTFVGTSGLLLAGTLLGGVPIVGGKSGKRKMEADGLGFPLMDLHVHRSSELSMEEILETSRNLNLKIGVMENVAPWGITCDEQLKAYLDAMKHYPVYVGLQPMSPGWSKGLSGQIWLHKLTMWRWTLKWWKKEMVTEKPSECGNTQLI